MKLLRYGAAGRERPALLDPDGRIRDLSSVVADISGATLRPEGVKALESCNPATLPIVDGNPRIGPCVATVGKIICVGLNYSDHAAESGMPIPSEPILFLKASSSIVGPNDDVQIPRPGQTMRLGIEGLGTQQQRTVAYEA